MASNYRFVPMAQVLRQLAKERGCDKIGGNRRVTVADVVNMPQWKRDRLADRLLRTVEGK